MLIRRASAAFGERKDLTLTEGLNILQAPFEPDAWCALLLTMLYGVGLQELNRAAFSLSLNETNSIPWSGRLECRTANGQEITLLRSASAAEFQAIYTGTENPVPGLDASTCGETLLGVSREIFARNAIIRQSGPRDAGLEQRIAALIFSAEASGSHPQAAGIYTLDKGNPRSHDTAGRLPALEAELRDTEDQLMLHAELTQRLEDLHSRCTALSAQESVLRAEQAGADLSETRRKCLACRRASTRIDQAARRAEALRAQKEHLPKLNAVSRLRGAIVNLETTRKATVKAREQRDEAMKALLRAENAVNESPFTGLTPEQVEQLPLDLPPKPRFPLWAGLLALLPGAALAGALYSAAQSFLLAAGCGCGLLGLALLCFSFFTLHKQKHWEEQASRQRALRSDALSLYTTQFQTAEAARAESAARSNAYNELYNALTSNEQGILLEVRRFAPDAFDIPAADTALRACAVRWKEIAEAEAAVREARLYFETLVQQLPAGTDWEAVSIQAAEPAVPLPEDSASPETLPQVQSERSAALSEARQISTRLQTLGDPSALRAKAQELRKEIGEPRREPLPQADVGEAGAPPQDRLSPALARRAADIFAELTGGVYSAAALDHVLRVSSRPGGPADQLYLAARLAICQLALPPAAPMILDDALASFDDQRCASALRWLRKEAEHRQILLFTCHSREADFFRDDPAVSIQRLERLGMEEPV